MVERPDAHVLTFFLALIVTSDVALVVGINNVPVPRIGHDKAALASASDKPIPRRDDSLLAPARDPKAGAGLLRTVAVIGIRVVSRAMVELCGGLLIYRRPRLAAAQRNARAAGVG